MMGLFGMAFNAQDLEIGPAIVCLVPVNMMDVNVLPQN
jgi:hypothetical protein